MQSVPQLTSPIMPYDGTLITNKAIDAARMYLQFNGNYSLQEFAKFVVGLTNNPAIAPELLCKHFNGIEVWLSTAHHETSFTDASTGLLNISSYELVSIAFSLVIAERCFINQPQYRSCIENLLRQSIVRLDIVNSPILLH